MRPQHSVHTDMYTSSGFFYHIFCCVDVAMKNKWWSTEWSVNRFKSHLSVFQHFQASKWIFSTLLRAMLSKSQQYKLGDSVPTIAVTTKDPGCANVCVVFFIFWYNQWLWFGLFLFSVYEMLKEKTCDVYSQSKKSLICFFAKDRLNKWNDQCDGFISPLGLCTKLGASYWIQPENMKHV